MNDLTTLLHEAVEDVEPADRFAQIRAGVRRRRTRRLWAISGGGAVIAAAATVAAIALATSPEPSAGPDVGPATHSPSVVPPTTDASTGPTEVAGAAIPVYYLGGTEAPKLYREFHHAVAADPATVLAELTSTPDDPDYRTLWPAGAFAWVKVSNDLITVQLMNGSLHDRPATMSRAEAEASIQQVIYTLQAYAQRRLPVQFTFNDNPIDQVLGVPTSEPLTNAPILQTLSRVNLITPENGQEATDSLEVEGVANSFEANVAWLLEGRQGTDVDSGSFTAEGYMAEKLFPFHGSIDVSSLDPGTYTLIVMTDDPSGAGNVDQDSRMVIIR
jgi:hypothetical protein